MAVSYKNIFKPCVLANGAVLKNRICFSNGQQSRVAGPEGGPNEALIDDAAAFARSGVSLMSFGHFGSQGGGAVPKSAPQIDKKAIRARGERVVKEDKLEPFGGAPSYNYDDVRTFNLIGQAAEAVHLFDSKILVKIGPSFPKSFTLNGVEEWEELLLYPIPDSEPRLPKSSHFCAPTPVGAPVPTLEELRSRAATKEMIEDAIEDVVDMCMRYKNAGFDGMSLRGDRWGVNACTNVRDDEYNGEIEQRGLFQYQLFSRIKEVCGNEFLVEVVMPGDSTHGHDGQLPHGYTEEEFIRFMKLVEPVIDIVEIREQTGMGYQCLAYNSELHTHRTPEIAKHLREAGFVKTIAINGGFNDPEEMEEILGRGYVDLISTCRTYRAEPHFMEKLRSGGKEVPTPCLRCNKCHGSYEAVPVCSVNPKNALNHRLPLIVEEPKRSKKVAVIGGGPIGMRTACFAAERGHQVTLFEKSGVLGGKVAYYGRLYPKKWALARYLDWLIDELKRRGVTDIRLNCEPDPDALEAEGFEAVIACTGSREKRPPVEGADQPGVYLNEDVYMGKVDPGQKIVIVGGGDVSTETAMYLASLGKDVTVLTRQDCLMKKQSFIHGPQMTHLVYMPDKGYGGYAACYGEFLNLKPVVKAFATKITPHTVTYTQDGTEHTIEADTVIVSGGYEPCTTEAVRYSTCTREFYMAGDDRTDNDCLMLGNRSAYGRAIML